MSQKDVSNKTNSTNKNVWIASSIFGSSVLPDKEVYIVPALSKTGVNNLPPSAVHSGTAIGKIAPPKPHPCPTPSRGSRYGRRPAPKNHRHNNRNRNQSNQATQSRSQTIKGATTNLPKETHLLRNRLDKLVESFHQTVVVATQSQTTRMESLHAENHQLRDQVEMLETENLKQFSELEDREEILAAMQERCLSLKEEVVMWKEQCESLTKEAVVLKDSIESYKREKGSKFLGSTIRTEERWSENESFKEHLSAKDRTIRDLEQGAGEVKSKLLDNKENNINNTNGGGLSGTDPNHWNDRPSLSGARQIFGIEIPSTFSTTKNPGGRSTVDTSSLGPGVRKSNRRKSKHGMTLRSA